MGKKPHGLVSTLFHSMYSWPLPEVHVVLHARVHVWHPMHLLMSNTAATCRSGRDSSYSYFIIRPSCQFFTSGIPSPPVLAGEVPFHHDSLVRRPESLGCGTPQPRSPDAAWLRPRDLDVRLLRGAARAVDVHLETLADELAVVTLPHEAVCEESGFEPRARDALMGAVAVHRLIPRARALRKAVLAGLVALDTPVRRDVHVDPRARGATRHVQVVPRAHEPTHDAVVVPVALPAAEGAIGRVPVDPDVVAILAAQVLRVERVHVHVPLADVGRALVVAVEVPERPEQEDRDVLRCRHGVARVAVLRCVQDELEPLTRQRMSRPLHVRPALHHVPDLANLRG